jgi:putative lipoic acid-binding regulatory protein
MCWGDVMWCGWLFGRELNCLSRVVGNRLRQNPGFDGLGFGGSGVNVKPRILISQGLSSSGIRGFGCAAATKPSQARSRDAAGVMQRLLIATHRRIPVDAKAGRPCLACRSSTSTSRNGAGGEDYDKRAELEESPPQDAVLKAISEVSKAEGRVGKTTNMVIGGTVKKDSESQWDAIDQKVNVYPMVRDFTAIGTGGDEFVQAMVQAVESITEAPVPKVTKKLSSQGKYISVRIGGITVTSSEQVRAVYDAMRKDVRMKYFL